MKALMRNGRDRRSENLLRATRGKSACFWLGPISGSHQGQQPQRLHSKAGYMAAPERFAKSQILFPCTAGAVHTWHEAGVPPSFRLRLLSNEHRTHRGMINYAAWLLFWLAAARA